jgi:hypothetical protein
LQRKNGEQQEELLLLYQDQYIKAQQITICFDLIDQFVKICEEF